MSDRRYLRPTAMDRAFNAVLAFVMRMGVSVYGSRVLAVRGRKSGADGAGEPPGARGRALPRRPARRDRMGAEHPRGRLPAHGATASATSREMSAPLLEEGPLGLYDPCVRRYTRPSRSGPVVAPP